MPHTKIHILDDLTINKIAAGEVIENPASVVKELVENSLDAGATEITIEIKGGGRQLIRVSDNGLGMSSDDALLCLERHATSKIRQAEDIQELLTMGFRGEAVPSIASISKFTLITALHGENGKNHEGTMVLVEGGHILSCSPATRSPGTTIEVKSLFFNVPVRKKFQRSPIYDTQEILKMISLLSLGYPSIKFELISDQKLLLKTEPASSDPCFQNQLGHRIENILGKDFMHAMRPLTLEKEPYLIQGYIGLPSYTRHNRTGQYLFINKRAVQSSFVAFALREGYGTMLPTQRYPIFVLHVQMPGDFVDVNVHPQKKEVRLRQEYLLKECLIQAVQSALKSEEPREKEGVPFFEMASSKFQKDNPLLVKEEEHPYFPVEPIHFESESISPFLMRKQPIVETTSSELFKFKPFVKVLLTIPSYILLDPSSLETNLAASLGIRINEGFCLVNQQSAYARLLYERLIKQIAQQKVGQDRQPLLIPLTLEFPPTEAGVLKTHLDLLRKMGLDIQEFGNTTFLIEAIPSLLEKEDLKAFLNELLEELKNFQETRRLQREKEKQVALAACRHSRVVNKRLSLEEAQGLINQLMECEIPLQCPIGRATITYLSSESLAKYFKA